MIDTVKIKDKSYYVLGKKRNAIYTDECMFCGMKHLYNGSKISKCKEAFKNGKSVVTAQGFVFRGIFLDPKDGCIIKEY